MAIHCRIVVNSAINDDPEMRLHNTAGWQETDKCCTAFKSVITVYR